MASIIANLQTGGLPAKACGDHGSNTRRSRYRLMDSQAPSTPQDLRADARNTLRLAQIARNGRKKAMLLNAAREFLNKAAELEASARKH